jgi:tRNA pseudouridine55 synthase
MSARTSLSGSHHFSEGEILLFDKPYGWTSFDLVSKVRNTISKTFKIKKLKVGHAGTLDPLATGLLILCTGKATKKIDSLQAEEKEYLATLKLGATTPSYDLESEENGTFPTEHLTLELIEKAIEKFTGTIEQVPPAFSAVKINGKRAYEHARKGNDPELKAKTVVITNIDVISFEVPKLILRITCSKGTYIRALARDLGEELQSGAYLTDLRRTRSGDYLVDNAWDMDDFIKQLNEQKTE